MEPVAPLLTDELLQPQRCWVMAPPNGPILIVEDDAIARHGLRSILHSAGYLHHSVESGSQALAALRSNAFSLVLLDMLLPETDGWSVLQAMQINPSLRKPPVVIMTALNIASDEWASNLGAAGLLRKPIEVDKLLAEVAKHSRQPLQ